MTMMCAEVKERLVDFLYDELSPEACSAFAKHLDGCPACKAEVASFQKTLGNTRAALGGPLSQEPPMRVRLAVLEAAAQAARPSVAQGTPAPRARHATSATSDDDGFFTRLLRSPWFLPAFGAASVATVVFLVRVLKNPEVLPGQRPHSIEESSVEAPKPALEPVPVDKAIAARPEGTIVNGKGSVAGSPPAEGSAGLGMVAGKDRGAVGVAKRKVHAELGRGTGQATLGTLGTLGLKDSSPVQGKDTRRFAEPPPSGPVPPAAPEPANVAATARPVAASQAAAPAASLAPAAGGGRVMKPETVRSLDLDLDDVGNEMTQDLAQPARTKKVVERRREGVAAATALVASEKADRKVDSPLDDSVRKAERLFASQDWNAAADAYRDLLRRFPSHKDVPKWRDRMNASTVAYQQTLEAKRKRKVSDDPLSGVKP
jgi:anti-sigma factor RsiW